MRKRQVLLTAAAMMTVCSLASGTYLTDIRADGNRTLLIENGRFVLPGTEKLNEPLDV